MADLISYFENSNLAPASSTNQRTEVDPSWDAGKKCYFRIVNRLKEGIEDDVVSAITDRISGVDRPIVTRQQNGGVRIEAHRKPLHAATCVKR